MFQGKAHKQECISKTESKAVALAQKFREFIDLLKNLKPTVNFDQILEQYMPLYHETMNCLETISKTCQKNPGMEVTNPYYWNLLIQISRYNQFFTCIQIPAIQHPAITIYPGSKDYQIFQENLQMSGIGGINHPLLKQDAALKLEATVQVDALFTDIHRKNDLYYYHLPPDPEGFEDTNSHLGWETGKSIAFNFLAHPGLGENQDGWFKPIDRERHETEKLQRKTAIQKIHAGQILTKNDKNCLYQGDYYRYASPIKFGVPTNSPRVDFQITHIGHGSEFIVLQNGPIPLFVYVNPIHGDASFWITRNMEAAFGLEDYPAGNVVLLTDFSPEHCSIATLKALFEKSGVLFIVPQGCGKILRAAGLHNISIIELASFNARVDIVLQDLSGNKSTYIVHGFPANHVCQRKGEIPWSAMSMGYLLPNMTSKEVLLIASNSAKLVDKHWSELNLWCRHHQLHIRAACLPMGPDRPRKMLGDQHQSTLDLLLMQAEFSRINGIAGKDISLHRYPCYLWGNNQGCFRQGLTSYRDVDATLLRILSLLKVLSNIALAYISEDLLKNYLIYHFMDTFEQKGFMDWVITWKNISPQTTTTQLYQHIINNVHIAMPGGQLDVNKPAFVYSYARLMLNSKPDMVNYNKGQPAACEYFLLHLDPNVYNTPKLDSWKLVCEIFTLYLKRGSNFLTDGKSEIISAFLEQSLQKGDVEHALGSLYDKLFSKADEARRNEGHTQTAFILLAGFLHFPDFRESMAKRHQILHDSICSPPSAEKQMENSFIK